MSEQENEDAVSEFARVLSDFKDKSFSEGFINGFARGFAEGFVEGFAKGQEEEWIALRCSA